MELGELVHRLTFTIDWLYLLTMPNLYRKCDAFLNIYITYAFTESVIIFWKYDVD